MQLVAEGDIAIDKIECQWMLERFQKTPLHLDLFEAGLMSLTALIRIKRIYKSIRRVSLAEEIDVDNQLAMSFMKMQAQHLELAEYCRKASQKKYSFRLILIYKIQLKLANFNARIVRDIIAHDAHVLEIPEQELQADLLMQELNQEYLNAAIQRVKKRKFVQHKLIHE